MLYDHTILIDLGYVPTEQEIADRAARDRQIAKFLRAQAAQYIARADELDPQ